MCPNNDYKGEIENEKAKHKCFISNYLYTNTRCSINCMA